MVRLRRLSELFDVSIVASFDSPTGAQDVLIELLFSTACGLSFCGMPALENVVTPMETVCR